MSSDATKRVDGTRLPESPPWGWMHLKLACCSLGWAMFEKGWPFDAFERAEWTSFDSGDLALDTMNRRASVYARKHRRKLIDRFAHAAYEARFVTGYRPIGGGSVSQMPPEWWATDDPMLRFRTFSIDPDEPFSECADLPCWIFVQEDSFGRFVDETYRERKGWEVNPQPFQFLRLVVDNETGPGRPGKTDRILELFAERLRAGTVLRRPAWEGRVVSDLSRGRPDSAVPKTCADRIRPFHKLIMWGPDDSVLNANEVLEAIGLR